MAAVPTLLAEIRSDESEQMSESFKRSADCLDDLAPRERLPHIASYVVYSMR